MKKIYIIYLSLLLPLFAFGQKNLVRNSGFDSTDCRRLEIYDWIFQGSFYKANYCYPRGGSPGPVFQPPFVNPNPWGYSDAYQLPRSNGGFIGLYVLGSKGYAISQLSQDLEAGRQYYCRFYVAPHYPYWQTLKWIYTDCVSMGMTYSVKYDNQNLSYLGEPMAIDQHGQFFRDTTNWRMVNGAYTAKGGERYTILGNLRDNVKVDTNGYVPWTKLSNMFYFDDVLVSEFNPFPDSVLLCENEIKTLDATFHDDPEYTWNDNSRNATLKVSKPGKYWVSLIISGKVFLSDTVHVVPEKGYKAIPKDTVVCEKGPPVKLTVDVEADYKWSTGETSKSININSGGTYSVTVTTPQCQLKFSTEAQSRYCFCDFFAPNAFTPNDDNINDTFKPSIDCKVIYIKDYRFSVYARNGVKVFSTTDRDKAWDGMYDGRVSDPGVYMWVVEYNTLIDNGVAYYKKVESGDVTIVGTWEN
jgi:gliding motility-associated-like protein